MIYPRIIAVHRLKTVAGNNDAIGLTGYSGAEQFTASPAGEAVLFTCIGDARESPRAIAAPMEFRLVDATTADLRALLDQAPRVGVL